MCRDWRDSSWTSIASVQNGLEEAVRQQRLKLFSKNEIDIKAKSTLTLLIDEVLSLSIIIKIIINSLPPGDPSILYFSDCQYHSVVSG